jgi:hypothetical protein
MKRNSLFVRIVEQNFHQKKLDFTAKFVNQTWTKQEIYQKYNV